MATIRDGLRLNAARARLVELETIEAQYERAYRTAERRHNAAFRYLNGQAPVDARAFTMAEYRAYSDAARRAGAALSVVQGKLDAMRALVDSLELAVSIDCDGDARGERK